MQLSDGRLYANIRPYVGWTGQQHVRLKAYSSDEGATWAHAEAEPALPDASPGEDEGSVVGDPDNKVVYFVHPFGDARANLTVWRSRDDAATWPDTINVYSGEWRHAC